MYRSSELGCLTFTLKTLHSFRSLVTLIQTVCPCACLQHSSCSALGLIINNHKISSESSGKFRNSRSFRLFCGSTDSRGTDRDTDPLLASDCSQTELEVTHLPSTTARSSFCSFCLRSDLFQRRVSSWSHPVSSWLFHQSRPRCVLPEGRALLLLSRAVGMSLSL